MIKDYPILDIGTKIGITGYLDFIKYTDVSAPVSIGHDMYNRPFIVIRAKITMADRTTELTMETFFQRYTYNSSIWQGCGPGDIPYFMSTEGGMNEEQHLFIEKLLLNGKVELDDSVLLNIKFGYNFSYKNLSKPVFIELI